MLRRLRPLPLLCKSRPSERYVRHIIHPQRRHGSSWNPISIAADGILEVGNSLASLPLPEFFGPYAAGIVLSTLIVRTAVTLPVFFWTRQRVARHRDIVVPEIIAWRKPFAKALAAEAKSKPDPKAWFDHEFKTAAIAKRTELLRRHKCQPFYTAIASPLTLIPTIVVMSLAVRSLCVIPDSPLLYEAFLSSIPLALPDSNGIFPLAVGMASMTSLEIGRKFARQRAGEMKEVVWAQQHATAGEVHPLKSGSIPAQQRSTPKLVSTSKGWEVRPTIQPTAVVPQRDSVMQKVSTTVDSPDDRVKKLSGIMERIARGGAVLMIGVSMWSPGALTLCWVTSATYSIAQTLLAQRYDKGHRPTGT